MMKLDLDKVRANVAKATTEDLLDRATFYRPGMEPEALELIDAELAARGIDAAEVAAHAARHRPLYDDGGLPLKCVACARPAVVVCKGWYRLFGLVPYFPSRLPVCAQHALGKEEADRGYAAPPEGWPADERRRAAPSDGRRPDDDHFRASS